MLGELSTVELKIPVAHETMNIVEYVLDMLSGLLAVLNLVITVELRTLDPVDDTQEGIDE